MKTKLFIAATLVVISTFNAFSQTTNRSAIKADIQMTEDKQMRIWYTDVQNEKVSFKIIDSEGKILMKKSYRGNGNMKLIFDMNRLEDGNYFVEAMSNDQTISSKQITVTNGKLCSIPVTMNQEQGSFACNTTQISE